MGHVWGAGLLLCCASPHHCPRLCRMHRPPPPAPMRPTSCAGSASSAASVMSRAHSAHAPHQGQGRRCARSSGSRELSSAEPEGGGGGRPKCARSAQTAAERSAAEGGGTCEDESERVHATAGEVREGQLEAMLINRPGTPPLLWLTALRLKHINSGNCGLITVIPVIAG